VGDSERETAVDAKSRLREEIDAKRKSMDARAIAAKSEAIVAFLESLPVFRGAQLPLVYIAMPSEVQTLGLVEDRLARGASVAVPRVVGERIEVRELKSVDHLAPGEWGILEPDASVSSLARLDRIDVVLVPGVAFDPAGHRLGFGKAYYDRLLASLVPKAKLIALAFEVQLTPEVPTEPHDVAMDLIVTERRIIDCAEQRLLSGDPRS
jgi:5-formyltetrahydrofolate cyclo-ligase